MNWDCWINEQKTKYSIEIYICNAGINHPRVAVVPSSMLKFKRTNTSISDAIVSVNEWRSCIWIVKGCNKIGNYCSNARCDKVKTTTLNVRCHSSASYDKELSNSFPIDTLRVNDSTIHFSLYSILIKNKRSFEIPNAGKSRDVNWDGQETENNFQSSESSSFDVWFKLKMTLFSEPHGGQVVTFQLFRITFSKWN